MSQVLSVAVYNHYKRIYHATVPKGLVFISFSIFSFCSILDELKFTSKTEYTCKQLKNVFLSF